MRRRRRVAVVDVVARLDGVGDLAGALREATGDASLRVGYPLDGRELLIDADGQLIEPTGPSLALMHGGRTVAVVLHADGTRIPQAVQRAAALAAANSSVAAELESSLTELRASRRKRVAAADEARRRTERDLHDGAQQRLVAAALDARMALMDTHDPAVRTALERTVEELQMALEQLRELARGLYPAILPERGLAPALASLAASARVRLSLVDVPGGRFDRQVEECVYFCIKATTAEAPGPVVARFVSDRATLHLTLEGAEIEEDWLELRDRVEAIGGAINLTGAAPAIELPLV